MRAITQETFANEYKKNRSPTMYLNQLPNLAAAHLGIFLGILGPMHVYTDSEYGAIHALDQAEADLNEGLVDHALVGGAFSFENPLTLARNERLGAKGKVLAEGAGLMVLKKSNRATDWATESFGLMPEYYGIADQIIEINERGQRYAN
jgi:3-oxoacyl-(acyl-carrier-protein) synthase